MKTWVIVASFGQFGNFELFRTSFKNLAVFLKTKNMFSFETFMIGYFCCNSFELFWCEFLFKLLQVQYKLQFIFWLSDWNTRAFLVIFNLSIHASTSNHVYMLVGQFGINCPSAFSKFSKITWVIYPKNCPNQTCDYWLITPNPQTLCIETNIF